MFITENILKQIIAEEYAKLIEAEVVPYDTFAKRQRMGKRGNPGYFEQGLVFVETIATKWAELYNQYEKKYQELKDQIGKVTKHTKDDTGVTKIVPSSKRKEITPEEIKTLQKQEKDKLFFDMQDLYKAEYKKLDSDLRNDTKNSILGKPETSGGVATPDISKQSVERFVQAWNKSRGIEQASEQGHRRALMYYRFFKSLFTGVVDPVPAKKPPEQDKKRPHLTVVKEKLRTKEK